VLKPGYDRATVGTGIVHLGIGAFHRAHQAVTIDDILAAGDRRWGIAGVSLRSRETKVALDPQDGLYTLMVRGEEARPRIIGSIREVLVAPDDPGVVIRRLAAPAVAIVSLTVTEKGYCHDPATGELNESHPLIRADLANPEHPQSAIGYLAAAIVMRRQEGVRPFTILSCDNLPANGRTLHRVLSRFAHLVSPNLGAYVADEIAAPSTMVDRIVPATTDADRAEVADLTGLVDAWPVLTEPFSQWVIEDRFSSGRPAFETVGVEMVADVAPYEEMKLRLLNGAHSALAYLGLLAGIETVADAIADPAFGAFVAALMGDAAETVRAPSPAELARYARSLIARFGNAALRHRLVQIATDGSQKLPQRILGAIRDRLAKRLPIVRHALVVAAWMRFVAGADDAGQPLALNDPLAAELTAIARAAGPEPESLSNGLLGVQAIFGRDLAADRRFAVAVRQALADLVAQGSRRSAAARI
jgi:fructuronate reductase